MSVTQVLAIGVAYGIGCVCNGVCNTALRVLKTKSRRTFFFSNIVLWVGWRHNSPSESCGAQSDERLQYAHSTISYFEAPSACTTIAPMFLS